MSNRSRIKKLVRSRWFWTAWIVILPLSAMADLGREMAEKESEIRNVKIAIKKIEKKLEQNKKNHGKAERNESIHAQDNEGGTVFDFYLQEVIVQTHVSLVKVEHALRQTLVIPM